MNNRPSSPYPLFKKYTFPILLGTFANTVATYVSLPLTYAYTQKQLPNNKKSYPQIFSFLLSKVGMQDVYKVSGKVIRMAPKQSLAYLGVTNAAFERFKTDTLTQRAMKAGFLSAFAESAVTARDLQSIVSEWGQHNTSHLNPRTIYARSMQATLLKNCVANPLSLTCILHVKYQLEIKTKSPSFFVTATAAMIGSMISGTFVAPFVTLQTRTQNDPSHTLFHHSKMLLSTSPLSFWKGGAGRIVQKSVQSALAFGIIEMGNNVLNKKNQ